mmetsp:Transcript_9242/g.20545  ORF Transcript_9242/g.20545 Transcript_9242/m.20545 type:complete len:112 (+) Transcript_9242:94-429(+)
MLVARAISRACCPVTSVASQVRAFSGIKILDEKARASEFMYWAAEDEKLLKKMIENNPAFDPRLQGISKLLSEHENSTVDKIKMIFMKHGIPPANKALIADIVELIEKPGP